MTSPTSIAIIGMSGRFPGADTLEQFWSNLRNGIESIERFSAEEMIACGVPEDIARDPGYVPAKGIVKDIAGFDAAFFGFSPREASHMDPQHRIFLECAWEALEHAGYDPITSQQAIGLYAGCGDATYLYHLLQSNTHLAEAAKNPSIFFGNYRDFFATRVAYRLNLRGPSINIQTACSTSLVAIHSACSALLSYQCDMAVAGGIHISLPHKSGNFHEAGGVVSPDGHCRAFDAQAAGTVASDGAGVVILKRLDDAIADGDTIHAVILGSAVNNDGADKIGYTAPSVNGQTEVITLAQEMAEINPEDISYIEAHGTGTRLGDPIEIQALTQAFQRNTNQTGYCAIGSLKSNIGHLDAAAGVAGLIKTVLALQHEEIPASLNFSQPNPSINFAESPFVVNASLKPWLPRNGSRIAGISSFGIGGTNAHAIVGQAPAKEIHASLRSAQLLVLSARTESALLNIGKRLSAHLSRHAEIDLADVGYTLQVGRHPFKYRLSLVASDVQDAVTKLDQLSESNLNATIAPQTHHRLAFLFPGQGLQCVHMGKALYENEPVFKEIFDQGARIASEHLDGLDLTKLLYPDQEADEAQTLINTQFAQPALFLVEYALGRYLESINLRADVMLGHSIGEWTAACLAGVFSFEDAMKLVCARGRLMQACPSGAMLGVELSEEDLRPQLTDGLEISVYNAENWLIVSGTSEEVEALRLKLEAKQTICHPLRVSHAFHSASMEQASRAFISSFQNIALLPPERPFISNVSGTWITDEQACSPAYWAQQLRAPVRFQQGVALLQAEADLLWIEVGPGRALSQFARLSGHQNVVSTWPQPKRDALVQTLEAIGRLWTSGVTPDWVALHGSELRGRIALPTYPFEHQQYWVDALPLNREHLVANPSSKNQLAEVAQSQPLVTPRKNTDLSRWFFVPEWKPLPAFKTTGQKNSSEPTLIILGSDSLFTASHIELFKNAVIVRSGSAFKQIDPTHFEVSLKDRNDYENLFKALENSHWQPSRIIHTSNLEPIRTGSPDADRAADRYLELLGLAQALGKCLHNQKIEMIVLANQLCAVLDADIALPDKATLLGPAKVIPLEYSSLTCRVIDLDADTLSRPERLIAEINEPDPARVIAHRNGQRFAQSYRQQQLLDQSPLTRLKDHAHYMITGGLGGVGLALAEHLIREAKAKLTLVNRSGFPPRIQWESLLQAENLPRLSDNADLLLNSCDAFSQKFSIPTLDEYEGLPDALTTLAQNCIHRYFSSAMGDRTAISIDELRQRLNIAPRFERMFQFMLNVLIQSSHSAICNDQLTMQPYSGVPTEEYAQRFPDFRGLIHFVDYCTRNYDKALSGAIPSIQVLYPEGKTGRLDEMQRDTVEYSQQRIYSHVLSEYLNKLAQQRPLRILEIGGGQGLLTRVIAPSLLASGSSYHFTDISPFFTNRISSALPELKGLTTSVFDITRDPLSQGLHLASYDVIVGQDVVHATPNIGVTLGHLRKLLAPSGYLGLLETVTTGPWVDLCWGLADGWWLYEDQDLRSSALMLAKQWEVAIAQAGFADQVVLPKNAEARHQCDVALILAQSAEAEHYAQLPSWQAEASQDPAVINRYRIEKILELERLGGEINIVSADISDQTDVNRVTQLAIDRFGPIQGVIHSAMVLEDKLMQLKDTESALRVLAPKVQGSLHLMEALASQPLDFFVHCSSLAAPMGLYAQSDYCAATSFQDALARSMKPGIGLSINWGVWRDAGFAMRMKLQTMARQQQWSTLAGPLLQRRTNDGSNNLIFEGVLTNQWPIAEHSLNDSATLPGTGYLSYVYEALKTFGNRTAILDSLIFSDPLTCTVDHPQSVRLQLEPDHGGYQLKIASLRHELWIENARGRIELTDKITSAIKSNPLDALQSLQKRFDFTPSDSDADQVTSSSQEYRTVSVGPRWQGLLRWNAIHKNEALGLIELPQQYHQDLHDYPLHAAMLDIATSFAMGDEAFYLPIAYSDVKIHAPLTKIIWSHLTWERNADSGAPTISFTVRIFNEDGELALEIGSYTLRKVDDSVQPSELCQLVCETPGLLDSLKYVPLAEQGPLAADEVEICVVATGLNFLDVLSALGMALKLPDSETGIGRECAGIISRVGSRVRDLKAGDEVIALAANAYDDLLTVHQQNVRIKPASMTWETAASFAVPFMTAHYALHHRANLRQGESVLIHAAAGGVGMAAIQLAQRVGARIFATAGSEEKRQYLRSLGIDHVFDSRSDTFADEIRRINERGIDVVLNCLGGDLMKASLDLLAPHGRFLELGKRDFAEDRQVGLSVFANGVTYFAINLGPELIEYQPVFDEVIDMFNQGSISPVPVKTYPVEQTIQAFSDMAGAKQIGKLVITRPAATIRHQNLVTFPGIDAPLEDAQLREGMSSPEGAQAFERALTSGLSQVLVTPQDFTALLKLNTPEKVRQAKEINPSKPAAQVSEPSPVITPTDSNALVDIVRESWIKHLGVTQIQPNDNFFSLGGDSLIGIQIMAYLRKRLGIEIPVAIFFEAPTLNELTDLLSKLVGKGSTPKQEQEEFKIAPGNRYDPFPLTDVQQAYWIGRSTSFELGNVAAHGYFEVERKDLNYAKFCDVWMQLVRRHDMLRMIVNSDGQQQILPEVEDYRPERIDLRGQSEQEALSSVIALREHMSSQILPSDRWPLFDIRVTLLPDSTVRIHMSFDALIMDAWSSMILGREFSDLYQNSASQLPDLEISFRDYVMYEQAIRESTAFEASKRYWTDRLDTLPAAPELPLAINPESLEKPSFTRREARLTKQQWSAIKQFAAQAGLTPSVVCLTCFGDVLARWSQSGHFSINLTLFNRPAVHPQIKDVVGDFTSLTLLEIDATGSDSYVERARRIQQQLGRDLDHRHFSGVQVLRELVRSGRRHSGAIMPVVFTSTLALESQQEQHSPVIFDGEIVYGISQTPQVWLDHGILEEDGELVLNWNAVEALFPAHMLDDMFDAYRSTLLNLAHHADAWNKPVLFTLPTAQQERRIAYNSTLTSLEINRLEAGFFKQAALMPEATAICSSSGDVSYQTLYSEACSIANELAKHNIKAGECVGVHIAKSWKQIAAVLGILRAGGAYVPLDPSLPIARLEAMTQGMRITISTIETAPRLPATLHSIPLENIQVDTTDALASESMNDLAYVIYTSGSTGKPKGVMIEHHAASNTIADLLQRFKINRQDRVLALSALGFDLSVFDIFALLETGGTLVMPDVEGLRDPSHWHSLLTKHNVTIWNSVPALMELLVDYAESNRLTLPQSVRLIMMSGDWIPVDLPARIRKLLPNVEIIGMGGATEASIWSIYYPIKEVAPDWKSIPYGYPLANQTYHVLNARLEDCPDWVTGELYIGGSGLSSGYWQNPEQTAERYITIGNQRFYKTGDQGRFWPDGWIEFQGRNDNQVKVQGYRIEIGEIETALRKHPSIAKCAVKAIGPARGSRKLAAYVVLNPGKQNPTSESLRDFLREQLPEYMVPRTFTVIANMPLSGNGKVDYGSLPDPGDLIEVNESNRPAQSAFSRQILDLVSDILKLKDIDPKANLLDLGADSISMIRLANRLQSSLAIRPSIADLYRMQSIADLIEYCEKANQVATAPLSARSSKASVQVDLITDPVKRQEFKETQSAIRTFSSEHRVVSLDRHSDEQRFIQRQSQRHFSLLPIEQASFGKWLSALRQIEIAGKPKYLYASAGGLYPVQTYLYVKAGRVEGLEEGLYYHDPVRHHLVLVTTDTVIDRNDFDPIVNQPIFDEAAFCVLFVAAMSRIEPMYGEHSERFVNIEVGLMSQCLDLNALDAGIGLCHIGDVNASRLIARLAPEDQPRWILSILGGLPNDKNQPAPEDNVSRLLARVNELSPEQIRQLLAAKQGKQS